VREPAGRDGPQLAELREDDQDAAVLHGDARGHEALCGVRFEVECVRISPAEFFECGQAISP
jgi:hypothetical protein